MSQPKTKIKNRNKKNRKAAGLRRGAKRELHARQASNEARIFPVPAGKSELRAKAHEYKLPRELFRHTDALLEATIIEEPKVVDILDEDAFEDFRLKARAKKRGIKVELERAGWTLMEGGDPKEASAWIKEA